MTHRTHVFTAPESAFFVNSFILEGERSVVVIDAQFLVSSAMALRDRVQSIGKPMAALILTHPHPDHYNGAATLLAGKSDVPVFSTRKTADGILGTAELKRIFWTPTYGDDYPQDFRFPDRIVGPDETLAIEDIVLKFDELGPGESQDMVVLYAPKTQELFASDLLYSDCHPWLAEDRSELWLAQLDDVAARYREARVVHAGHGLSGDLRLLREQQTYIRNFRDRVAAWTASGFDEAAKQKIRSETEAVHPGWPLGALIDLNSESIVRELSS